MTRKGVLSMAQAVTPIEAETRSQRKLILSLLFGAVVSTVGISNTRALFDPIDQIAAVRATPSAMAALTGEGPAVGAVPVRFIAAPVGAARRGGTRNALAAAVPAAGVVPAGGQPAPAGAPGIEDVVAVPPAAPAAPAGPPVAPGPSGGPTPFGPPTPPSINNPGGPGDPTTNPPPTDPTNPTNPVDPTTPLPEPETWAMMILGFAIVGGIFYRSRRQLAHS
jgi:hypothetical protein